MRNRKIKINKEDLQDIINIKTGVFYPLKGFMNEIDYRSVVDKCTLSDGSVFTIPITFDLPLEQEVSEGETLQLEYDGMHVADLKVEDLFYVKKEDWEQVFGTNDNDHPGVRKESERSPLRAGGKITLVAKDLLDDALKPSETKAVFKKRGWDTVVGFQTRNPIHKAHEYIQRSGLEICDGLFINPLTGWKKEGDFTQEAVMAAYKVMIEKFYPEDRVYLAELKTQMRYAGPREAIFHAIIRRNLGCTHFIIGRDHAGVGGYYDPYAAHNLAKEIQKNNDIGIKLLLTREPYYCSQCRQIVTDRTCSHFKEGRIPISGTAIRKYIADKTMPDEIMMRNEILEAILSCNEVFIKNEI